MRLIKGVPNTLPVGIEGDEGPLTFDAPPTVVLSDPSGVQAATGTATGSAGAYTFAVPPLSRLGVYTVTVSGKVSAVDVSNSVPVELVGGSLFSVPDARNSDDALTDTVRYKTAAIKDARDYVTDEFGMITARSFVLRGARKTVHVGETGVFYVDSFDTYRVVSAEANGVAVDVAGVTIDDVGVGAWANATADTLTVEYEYGFRAVPADVKRAALTRARTVLFDRDSGIPDRAITFALADGGSYRLATAGAGGFETGIPDVDAVLARYSLHSPGVA